MKPASFDYVRPKGLDEALRALQDRGPDAIPLAGGQSLLPLLGLRMAKVDCLIDVGRLPELRMVENTPEAVFIGAGITHAEIEDGHVPDPGTGLLRRMAARIAYRAVRNQGTIGGSVAMADPAADWPACLTALNASARIAAPTGERTVPVGVLIEDIFTTSLTPDEIIVSFSVPRLAPTARTAVVKVSRKTGAFAMSIAVAVLNDGPTPSRIVLGGYGSKPTVLRATGALLQARPDAMETDLRDAVGTDLFAIAGDEDAYAVRLHTAVVLRAIAGARSA